MYRCLILFERHTNDLYPFVIYRYTSFSRFDCEIGCLILFNWGIKLIVYVATIKNGLIIVKTSWKWLIIWLNQKRFLYQLFTRRKLSILLGQVWDLCKCYRLTYNISRHDNFRFVLIGWIGLINIKSVGKYFVVLIYFVWFFIVYILWYYLTIGC